MTAYYYCPNGCVVGEARPETYRPNSFECFFCGSEMTTEKPKFVAWSCPDSTDDNDHDEYLVAAGRTPDSPCSKCGKLLETEGQGG